MTGERFILTLLAQLALILAVTRLMADMERNGVCHTGIASDRRMRGTAINTAACGWNLETGLAVVQVRQCEFHPRKFNKVRKDYYLVGHNENGSFFAHPIDSPLRSGFAVASPTQCVEYVLAKIWGVNIADLGEVVRQGDIALIPVVALPEGAKQLEETSLTLRDSHVLTGEIWTHGDTVYTRRGAKLNHTKHEHRPIKAKYGFYRVAIGYRATPWGFSAPTAD
jgi:hypothetical protein